MNPFAPLTPQLLDAMTRQPMFFVRQYYKRGFGPYDDKKMVPLLFTHYIHHTVDSERAERHMRLLGADPYRFLYDSTNEEHLQKLRMASLQPEGFRIYVNLLPKPWKAGDGLKRKISSYVQHQLSWWNYNPADRLKVTLKDRYGALYLGILWKHQQTEVLLEEIENYRPCVTT